MLNNRVLKVLSMNNEQLYREGQPLPSAGSVPSSGDGPYYNFSRVGQMSTLLLLYLTVMHVEYIVDLPVMYTGASVITTQPDIVCLRP